VAKILRVDGVEAGILENFIFIRQVPLGDLTDPRHPDRRGHPLAFVFYGVQDVARAVGQVADAYDNKKKKIMEVCNHRRQGAILRFENNIKRPGVGEDNFQIIMDSVDESRREFDESLLLWHVATDLCGLRDKDRAETATEARLRPIGETLSEYMLYLLIKQPEMLSATAGIGLLRYRDTCAEARRFFASMDEWVGGDHAAARALLLRVNTSQRPATVKGDRSKSVLFDAVILAKALRGLADDELMWEVVAGVWGEMLTYAAGRYPRLVPHGAHGARRHVPDTGRGRQG